MLSWPKLWERISDGSGVSSVGQLPRHWRQLVASIDHHEPSLRRLEDGQLRKAALSIRYQAKSGQPLESLLGECYALVREAAHRSLGMRHYNVQLQAGIAMQSRCVVQMQTGEGKTLSSTLPLCLFALSGRGAHLATANCYLARRDAEWMKPLYDLLGLSVGIVDAETPQPQRALAYSCDVTYGTAKEFAFDFLRDRLQDRKDEDPSPAWLDAMLGDGEVDTDNKVQRSPHFILIDEADSILIDEARTPLIISSLPEENLEQTVELIRWAAEAAEQLCEQDDFSVDPRSKIITFTSAGRRRIRTLPRPNSLHGCEMFEVYERVEKAIHVRQNLKLDQHYVLRDGEVVIVDEFTGRLAEGRRWRDGLHQAVEAREQVEISPPSQQAARVTMQEFFRRYPFSAGMTGTVANSGAELRRIYRLGSAIIPTHRPLKRKSLPTVVFGTAQAKWEAVVKEICVVREIGRPVLVGTRSIEKSEMLSRCLRDTNIDHQVLNARHIAAEADIVAAAGGERKVTIATNMAGRGTDIKLGQGVESLGGLHVICTEMHDSSRIDHQLIGRCGRQGDPGSYRQYLALDDDILSEAFGPAKASRYATAGQKQQRRWDELVPLFTKAQQTVEAKHYRQRRQLMHHEQERRQTQLRMGLDPFLDAPG